MASTTYDLFFTGRDDPRSCVIIGEATKPLYFCFETAERNLLTPNVRTMVYRNNKEVCAKLEWSPGNHLGGATIGNRQMPMSQLVLPGTSTSARTFVSADGKKFEWRRSRDNPTSYDLYASQNMRIAVFRRYTQATAIGPSHAVLQYTFTQDWLLTEALVALCVNRWIDLHGV
ncbi:hypothetical protein GALMADRAFT_59462 [Galerina marginata CBS 339.88]|uniref:DUF6593 domain-containing protein n=1 Tax=Galerina marginata (strain CBS 339.88) TaxID=685588 RepID=A0A067TEY6_GALM3|nr:hypothetical protein GALMADRAFT_59462 [Galerina marginata CBS 339.88]